MGAAHAFCRSPLVLAICHVTQIMAAAVLASVSTTPNSTVTAPKRNRSVAWRHFEKDSSGNQSKCKLCGDLVKDSGNTTNLFKVGCRLQITLVLIMSDYNKVYLCTASEA